MTKSEANLWEAFAGESQANRKYLAFAKQAEKEGFKQVAKLFRAAAEAETVHAHTHLHVLKGVGSTAGNLKAAVEGETHEFESMYPKMIEEAQAEGNKQAERSFRFANEVEKVHADLYKKALADPAGLAETEYYICSVCGYTCEDHAPDKCPVCQAASKAFYTVG
ncbi:MAG: rubrerythrin family protein [Thermodesulfobacteriota bacterium]